MSETVPTHAQKPTSGMAIAALVLGIIAIISSWVPIVNNFSFLLGLIGLVFAIIAMVGVFRGKKGGKGIAIASLVINILSLVIVLATQSAYSQAIDDATVTTDKVTVERSTDDNGQAVDSGESRYTISDESLSGDEYSTTVNGTLKNNTDSTISYLEVKYALYDKDGNQLGTALDVTNSLEPGGSWKFKAWSDVVKADVASYKVASVSGF